jgi:hypothetical protein
MGLKAWWNMFGFAMMQEKISRTSEDEAVCILPVFFPSSFFLLAGVFQEERRTART